jgi:hypothetical protein
VGPGVEVLEIDDCLMVLPVVQLKSCLWRPAEQAMRRSVESGCVVHELFRWVAAGVVGSELCCWGEKCEL